MIEPRFELTREAIAERSAWTFHGRLWKSRPALVGGAVEAVRIPPGSITAATIRIYPEHLKDDPAQEITGGAEDILNTGRGLIVDTTEAVTVQGVTATLPVTILTINFTADDSRIVDEAAVINVAPRTIVPGERHVALVVLEYETGRVLRRPIVWSVVNLHLVP